MFYDHLSAHYWLNWVDEDDDDEVDKPRTSPLLQTAKGMNPVHRIATYHSIVGCIEPSVHGLLLGRGGGKWSFITDHPPGPT